MGEFNMDINTIANEAFKIVLPSLIAIKDGGFKSIGSDLWELIKKSFKSNEKDKKIVDQLEENPNDLKLQGIAEYKLAEFLEGDSSLSEELMKYIKSFNEKKDDDGTINIKESKNIVIAKDIDLKNGDFIVGDGDKYGKRSKLYI